MKGVILGLLFLGLGLCIGANGGMAWLGAIKAQATEAISDKVLEISADMKKEKAEREYILQKNSAPQKIELKTTKTWTGDNSKVIEYHVTEVPVVVNASYILNGRIVEPFRMSIEREIVPGCSEMIRGNVLTTSGDYIITVEATGYHWQIDIGEE